MEHTPTTTREEMCSSQTQPQNHERFFKRSESILAGSSASESEGDTETRKSNQKFFGPSRALIESPDLVGTTNLFGGGGLGENSFSRPLSETYPLAQQPHLLKPFAKKEHLFSSPSRIQGSGEGGGGEGGGEGGEGGGEGRGGERRKGKGGSSLPVSYGADGGG